MGSRFNLTNNRLCAILFFYFFYERVFASFELNCPESRILTLIAHRILQSYGLHSYNNILIYLNIPSQIQDESLKMSRVWNESSCRKKLTMSHK